MATYKDEYRSWPHGNGAKDHRNQILIYYIPGNPGLVDYYQTFLNYLATHLNGGSIDDDWKSQRTFHVVHGNSLGGFDIKAGSRTTKGTALATDPPLGLQDQIEDVYARLSDTVNQIGHGRPEEGQIPVILIGHSIGTYISMEVIRKWQEKLDNGTSRMKIIGSILLFPTICELAESPNGRFAGPLARIPFFPTAVHIFAAALLYLVPISICAWLIRVITGQPRHGSEVTAEFLKSKHGVEQALHLARDELAQVTTDKWTDSLWGFSWTGASDSVTADLLGRDAINVSSPDRNVTQASRVDSSTSAVESVAEDNHVQLYFFWGLNDHWIAETTRDKIIAARCRVEGRQGDERKPVMMVDQTNLPHAFCLTDSGSVAVARQCQQWIEELEHKTFEHQQ